MYGFYSAFLTLGMTKGVWGDWTGVNSAGLSAFVYYVFIRALGSAVNDVAALYGR